ncbi:hypothetical protein VTL71DRAFT_8983 [Oculimacula yallundae]|uniref:F-box domain-containing protein n=1 Tax=Oculimacula yallundae TaxID=86028 RepID=A0ABR4BUZ2_9HELO
MPKPPFLLRMPIEVLSTISAFVNGWEPHPKASLEAPNQNNGAAEIQNLRLTCKVLCDASSKFLVPTITIDFGSPASIERLEEISQHPEIRRGVVYIRAICKLYDPELGADFDVFVRHQLERLRTSLTIFRNNENYWPNPCQCGCSEHGKGNDDTTLQEYVDLGEEIRDAWSQMLAKDGYGNLTGKQYREEWKPYQDILTTGFEQYQKRVALQWQWRENEVFCRKIATAMARMPWGTCLQIDDPDTDWTTRYKPDDIRTLLGSRNSLSLGMLHPVSSTEVRKIGLGYPPTDLLVKLLIAIHKAGVSLTSLVIQSQTPDDFFALASSKQHTSDLTAAMQRLENFHLRPVGRPLAHLDNTHRSGLLAGVQRFSSAVLDSPSLEKISLDLYNCSLGSYNANPKALISSMIPIRPRPNLKMLSMNYMATTLDKLVQVFDSCNGEPILFSAQNLLLLDSEWEDGLDLLRGKVTSGSILSQFSSAKLKPGTFEMLDRKTFDDPFWSMWLDFPPTFGWFSYDPISPNVVNIREEAEKYIKGYIDENPLRVRT